VLTRSETPARLLLARKCCCQRDGADGPNGAMLYMSWFFSRMSSLRASTRHYPKADTSERREQGARRNTNPNAPSEDD